MNKTDTKSTVLLKHHLKARKLPTIFIGVLRLLQKFSRPQLTAALEHALDIDVIDADSIRTIIGLRSDQPVPVAHIRLF